MRRWYLRKNWIDRESNIETVHIHYTCTLLTDQPDWTTPHERWPMSSDRSLLSQHPHHANGDRETQRSQSLGLPTALWDARQEKWSSNFYLHYFFEIFQSSRRWITETFSEEIVYRDLEYDDWEGRLSGVSTFWSVSDWDSPMWTTAEDPRFIESFGPTHERCSDEFYRFPDKPRFALEKWNLMKQLPLPWRWTVRVFAPKGAVVRQRWHIGNTSPGIGWEDWDPHPPGDFVHFL